MKRKAELLVAILAGCWILNGCAADVSSENEVRITTNQLSEIDYRADVTRGSARASFAVHRNGLRDPASIQDPAIESPYDADLIIRNRHGYAFLVSGNHGMPIDPDTGVYPERAKTIFAQEDQAADLQLAIDSLDQLRIQPGVGKTFHGELRNLYYMAIKAKDGMNDMVDGLVVPERTPGINEINPALLAPATPSTVLAPQSADA